MRVECESCKEIVVAAFAIDGAWIRATCPACNATMTASTAAASAAPLAEGCPKCGAPRAGEPACPSCGLSADRMPAFVDARDRAVPEPVRVAWQRVTEAWGDPARHDELLRLVAIHDCYAWTAARYRDVARGRTGDPVVDRGLERLRRAAEATLIATATVRRDPASKPYRATIGVLVMLIVALAAGVLYAMVIRPQISSNAGEATPQAPALPVQKLDPARPMHPGTQVR